VIKRTVISIIFLIILACYFLLSCGPGTYINPSTGKVWQVDPDGSIQTNDLERLQRATPFKIVIPRYIPDELISVPVMYTKTIGMNSQNDVDIRFSYTNGTKSIDIEQVNYMYNWILNENMENQYLNINGIRILQTKSEQVSGQKDVNVYSYTWNKNEISFIVDIWDYNEDTSRKIVESMTK